MSTHSPEETARRTEEIAATVRAQSLCAGDFRLRRKDGSIAPVATRISGLMLENRLHFVAVFQDVTERRQAVELLELQRDVNRVLSSMDDLKAALDHLLAVAMKLEGIDSGGVYLVDRRTGTLVLTAHSGLSASFVALVGCYPADSAQGRMVNQGQPHYARPEELHLQIGAACGREGLRSLGVVPMRDEHRVIAVLNVASHERDSIATPTRLVLETIAAQAQGAIARIQAQEARRQTETRLRTIINAAPIVLYAADRDGMITFEEGRVLRTLGITPGEHVGRPASEVFANWPSILESARRALAGEEINAVLELPMGLAFDCRYSPVRGESGRVTGCIGVATEITERMRLEEEILTISDREQARIGQDLHDGLCQQLVSIAFDANALAQQLSSRSPPQTAQAERIAALVDEAITEARHVARGLYPVKLEARGLISALEELAASTGSRFGIDCQVRTPARIKVRNNVTATHLYRIAQEAVSNAAKHSGARQIQIRLHLAHGLLHLEVSDDGRGIGDVSESLAGMGLHCMDYRARSIGGSVRVVRQPTGGTLVSCCVPRQKL